jgi:ATP-dependent protease ClpP protease subunit
MRLGEILIENKATEARIKIAGYIGIPEDWQFESESEEISTKERLQSELDKIRSIDAKRVKVEIDSFGGSVNHGFAIYNALKSLKADVRTVYTGWSASIATIIGMAGNDRIAYENTYLLIHEVRGAVMGTANSLENYAEWMRDMNEKAVDIYSKGGGNKEQIIELMQVDNGEGKWIEANQALGLGIITKVDTEFKAAAIAPETLLTNKLPKNNIKMTDEKSLKSRILEAVGFRNDEALLAENTSLSANLSELTSQVENLTANLEAERANVQTLTTDLQSATDANATLTASIENLNAEIESLTAQLEAKKINLVDADGGDPDPNRSIDDSVKRDLALLRSMS